MDPKTLEERVSRIVGKTRKGCLNWHGPQFEETLFDGGWSLYVKCVRENVAAGMSDAQANISAMDELEKESSKKHEGDVKCMVCNLWGDANGLQGGGIIFDADCLLKPLCGTCLVEFTINHKFNDKRFLMGLLGNHGINPRGIVALFPKGTSFAQQSKQCTGKVFLAESRDDYVVINGLQGRSWTFPKGKSPNDIHYCSECFKAYARKSRVLKKCGGCQSVYYCSTECQRKNRKIHRDVCDSMRDLMLMDREDRAARQQLLDREDAKLNAAPQ